MSHDEADQRIAHLSAENERLKAERDGARMAYTSAANGSMGFMERIAHLEAALQALVEKWRQISNEAYVKHGAVIAPGIMRFCADELAALISGEGPTKESHTRVDEGQPRRIEPTGSTAARNELVSIIEEMSVLENAGDWTVMKSMTKFQLDRLSIRIGCESEVNRQADFELKRRGYVFDAQQQRWTGDSPT